MKRASLVFLLLALAVSARAQKVFYGADSAEKVLSALRTAIPSSQTITSGSPFKVAVTLGDGTKFARIPKPFIITCAPQAETPLTAIEEFICSAVSNDTLTLTARHLSNTTAHTWAVGSYIGYRLSALMFKQLQDTVNWLITSAPGTGTVRTITFQSPLTGGTITDSGVVTLPAATGTQNGYLTSTDWTTFNNKIGSLAVTAPLTYSLNTISLPQADATHSGYVATTDWSSWTAKFTLPDTTGKTGQVLTVKAGGPVDWSSVGSGTVTSVNVSGGLSGLTFGSGPITNSGTITLNGGALTVPYGGTGGTTKEQAQINILPDTTGKTTKYLRIEAGGGLAWDTAVGSGGSGSGTVTSVNVSGGTTGLTTSGGPVTTTGTITIAGTLGLANGGTGATTQAGALKNLVPDTTGKTGDVLTVKAGGGITWNAAGGTGTVTSVGITGPSILSWANSPVTSSGTLTGTLVSQSANLFLASPDGSSGAPTMRSIVSGDIGSGIITNTKLANSSVTVTAGTGLSGGGSVALGSSVTLTNAGVTSLTGTANQVSVSASTGAVTLSTPQDIGTGSAVTFGGLTLTGASGLALTNATQPTVSLTNTKGLTVTDGTNTLVSVIDSGTTGGVKASGFIGNHTSNLAGNANAYTPVILLDNTTASTSGAKQQWPGFLQFNGHGWSTTTTAADSVLSWQIGDTTQTAAIATSALVFRAGNTSGFTQQAALTNGGILNVAAGYQVNGAATSGNYLRGDGTKFVSSAIQAGDVPTLNQNTTGSAASLTTPRAIYGNNFDGTAALTQVIASTYGGTGNGFTKFSGPASTEKTFTLPNASATILTDNAVVTAVQGGTGTGTYATGDILYASATNTLSKLTAGTNGQLLVLGSGVPTWTSSVGTLSLTQGMNLHVAAPQTINFTTATTDNVVQVDASGAPITATLTASPTIGQWLIVVKSDATANAVTVQANTGQSISSGSVTLASQWASKTFIYLGSNQWLAQ